MAQEPSESNSNLPAVGGAEATYLRQICKRGDLRALEAWIAAGRSTRTMSTSPQPLVLAVRTGFYTMVEVLFQVEREQAARERAFRAAINTERPDLVRLMLENGMPLSLRQGMEFFASGSLDLMQAALDFGHNPVERDSFAHAFISGNPGTVGLFKAVHRAHPEWAAVLDGQVDRALRWLAWEGKVQMAAKMQWLGGDPRRKGPMPSEWCRKKGDYISEEECDWTTAIDAACYQGHLPTLKLFKPNRKIDDLQHLLQEASSHLPVIDYLVGAGAVLNDKPDGGSTVMSRLIGWRLAEKPRRHDDYLAPFVDYRTHEIEELAKRGAKWTPDHPTEVQNLLRNLLRIPGYVGRNLAELVRKKYNPFPGEVVRIVFQCPALQKHAQSYSPPRATRRHSGYPFWRE